MGTKKTYYTSGNTELLFFILIFLLLFYDSSPLYSFSPTTCGTCYPKDNSILFFILIFLLLFYDKKPCALPY